MYLIYDKETGIVDRAVYGSVEAVSLNVVETEEVLEVHDTVVAHLPAYSYVNEGVWVPAPQAPSPYHDWDWPTKSWLPNLDAARESKLQQVTAELNTRLYLPCNGFDADKVSRERISGMIARLQRGDGLPAGWIGWRDADNQQRWAEDDAATVLANLTTLSRVIEDREQALLVAGWTHKANVAALEDIDAIAAYDVTAGWPT